MQLGEDHLGGRLSFLFVNVNRHTPTVVPHRHGLARMDDDIDLVAVAGQRLVDGVVDELLDHVMKPGAVVGVADVHSRSFANGFKAAQDLDIPRIVGFFVPLRGIVRHLAA